MNCSHPHITHDGNCTTCGSFVQQYHGTENGIIKPNKSPDRSIIKDLENLDLPFDIKIKADEIAKKLNCSSKRGSCHEQLVFFCVYAAYIEKAQVDKREYKNPAVIAKIVGIKKNKMSRALSMFSEAQTGYKLPAIRVTAVDYLPEYCEKLNLSPETISDVIVLCNRILEKEPDLNETYPQQVAAGVLFYYAMINGITLNSKAISKKEFAELVELSEVTLGNIYKKICLVDNQK